MWVIDELMTVLRIGKVAIDLIGAEDADRRDGSAVAPVIKEILEREVRHYLEIESGGKNA